MNLKQTRILNGLSLTIIALVALLNSEGYAQIPINVGDKNSTLVNEPFDISGDFRNFSNTYYLADSLSAFDPKTGKGEITYHRYEYSTRQAFNNMLAILKPVKPNEFPEKEYAVSPALPFSIEFVSARTIRIRASSRFQVKPDQESLMLVNGKAPQDLTSWKFSPTNGGYRYTSQFGSVIISTSPWRIEIRDATGKILTRTVSNADGP